MRDYRGWVLAMVGLVGAGVVTACATIGVGMSTTSPVRFTQEAAVPSDTIRCDPIPAEILGIDTIRPGERAELRYPNDDPVVMVIVRDTLARVPIEITTRIPEGTHLIEAYITAEDLAGNAITKFNAPVEFRMLFRNGCRPRKPRTGQSFYIYRSEDPTREAGTVEKGGQWNDALLWEKLLLLQFTPRVDAETDHFSRYLIAQG